MYTASDLRSDIRQAEFEVAAIRPGTQAEDILTTLRRLDTLDTEYPGLAILASASGSSESQRLDLLESLLSEALKRQASKILLSPPFSAGIILAYFILKSRETASLITILNAKYYQLGEARIKEIL